MPTRAERDRDFMFDALKNLSTVMAEERKRKKREEIEREILGEPLEAYKLRDLQEDNELQRELKRAQLQRAMQQGSARATVPRGEDGLTAYQRRTLDLRERNLDRLSQPRQAKPADDERAALEKEMRKKFGFDMADIEPILKHGTPVLEDGTVEFNTRAGVPMKLKKDDVLPYMSRASTLYKNAMAAQSAPQVTAPKTDSLTIPPDKGAEADAIRAAYKAGTITREEARAKLAALAGL